MLEYSHVLHKKEVREEIEWVFSWYIQYCFWSWKISSHFSSLWCLQLDKLEQGKTTTDAMGDVWIAGSWLYELDYMCFSLQSSCSPFVLALGSYPVSYPVSHPVSYLWSCPWSYRCWPSLGLTLVLPLVLSLVYSGSYLILDSATVLVSWHVSVGSWSWIFDYFPTCYNACLIKIAAVTSNNLTQTT